MELENLQIAKQLEDKINTLETLKGRFGFGRLCVYIELPTGHGVAAHKHIMDVVGETQMAIVLDVTKAVFLSGLDREIAANKKALSDL